MPQSAKPKRVRVRMYNVGFGDTFLLSFEYAKKLSDGRSERHILIDFGSTSYAISGFNMEAIAKLVKKHCGGKLDMVVVSHRHKDHVAGFGYDAPSEIIEDLAPDVVVRPWTENPDLEDDDRAPSDTHSLRLQRHIKQEEAAAERLALTIFSAGLAGTKDPMVGALFAAASDNIPNQKAIDCLDRLSAGGRGKYVYFGYDLQANIEDHFPGVRVSVLGPPTPQQHPGVSRQRSEDEEQFWVSLARLAGDSDSQAPVLHLLGRDAKAGVGPRSWIIQRMRRQHISLAMELVRWLDDALNNTSVILLFRVGNKRLLFPGDAQIENWEYALSKSDVRREMKRVDLYKVSHHGSRNGTPKKSLFELWTGPDTSKRSMVAIMSSKPGVHGETEATAVPKQKLIDALEGRMPLVTTMKPEGVRFAEMECDLRDSKATFKLVSSV